MALKVELALELEVKSELELEVELPPKTEVQGILFAYIPLYAKIDILWQNSLQLEPETETESEPEPELELMPNLKTSSTYG